MTNGGGIFILTITAFTRIAPSFTTGLLRAAGFAWGMVFPALFPFFSR
jgi:hypothetical protein